MPLTSPRPRADADLLAYATSRLTARDKAIADLLLEHQVLTTAQIADSHFDTLRRAQRRLLALYQMRVIDRVRPLAPTGSAPNHWILDEVGATITAAARGQSVADLGWRRDRALAVAHSSRLAHLVGVNALFTALLGYARTHPDHQMPTWWSEQRCAAAVGQLVRPDGYGIWARGPDRRAFFLEHDRGTETLTRLADKLDGYRNLAATRGHTPILFHLPGPAREAALRKAIAGHPLAADVATTWPGAGHPAQQAWLPTRSTGRIDLIDVGR